jgi:hypothetical protein
MGDRQLLKGQCDNLFRSLQEQLAVHPLPQFQPLIQHYPCQLVQQSILVTRHMSFTLTSVHVIAAGASGVDEEEAVGAVDGVEVAFVEVVE